MPEGADVDGVLAMFVQLLDRSTSPDGFTTVTLTVDGLVIPAT
jgi:hypothetical protein